MAAVDASRFVELLKALSSTQNAERQQAEKLYQQAKASEPDSLVVGLLTVISNQGVELSIRQHGAVLLRQLVGQGFEQDFAFTRMAHQRREEVATGLLTLFAAEAGSKLQRKVGDVIAKLADSANDTEDKRGWLSPSQPGWPGLLQQVFKLSDATTNSNATSCECSIRLLKDLVVSFKEEIVGAQKELGAVLQNAFACNDVPIKVAALLLVCEIVGAVEKKAWAPLVATSAVLYQIVEQTVRANLADELQECLKALVEVASLEPDFFKQQLSAGNLQPATLMSDIVRSKQADAGVRTLALEWIISYAEKKPKWLTKSLPAFAPLAIECCMEMMLEMEDGDEELEAWVTRMDDEEGEEDSDELFHSGEEAIDRVVAAVGMEHVSKALFALMGRYAMQNQWQAKHAALAAVKQTVEYLEESCHISEMAKLLLQHVEHPHPRIRYTALHALGQLANDQAPKFQEESHQTVMPVFLKKMDDPVDRVAAMAMSAFVSFGEELDNSLMLEYSRDFMQKLVARLQTTSHRMVQEESITSIAVIAGVMEKDFAQYYDGIMPLLKQLLMRAKGDKEGRLRGKAFECMSLLGIAVGKERFLPDSQEALAEMLKTSTDAEDIQREYITEASQRICKCLKGDFAQFLPHLLPGIFQSLKLNGEEIVREEDDDEEYVTVTTGDGKLMKVHSSKFDELSQSVQLLHTYCSEMEGAFFDYVPSTAQAVLPLLSTDDMPLLDDGTRSAAYQTWAALIQCARIGATAKGQQGGIAVELLRTFLQKVCTGMAQEEDPESLREAALGIAECLKNAGAGALSAQEVPQFVQQLFHLIDASFARTQKLEKAKQSDSVGAPPELQQDEDDEDTSLDDEDNCRQALVDALGAVMQVVPAEFLPCLPECGTRMTQWLSSKPNRALALFMGCELLRHLKEQSETLWPILMPAVSQCLLDNDPEVRISAAFAVNLAAPLPNFAQAAPEAFRRLAKIVGGPTPKKSEDRARVALDNATSALLALAVKQAALCPAEVQAWQLVVSRLPLKDDEEEARKVHESLADLVLAEHAGLCGAHLGKVLSVLAEVYRQEDVCAKETDTKILQLFQRLPRESLISLASNFSQKQQKKIERMLTSA